MKYLTVQDNVIADTHYGGYVGKFIRLKSIKC